MKLLIQDRIMLQQLLPQKESFLKMILIDDIMTKLKFTPTEISEFGIHDVNGDSLQWKKNEEKDFAFTKEQIDILLDVAKKLDEAKEVTILNLNLVKKIYEYANPAKQLDSN